MKIYDIAVIGAGSAGLVAATTAHRRGLKTVMLEKNKIGGECTHSGCVPSKTLINAAKNYRSMNKATLLGLPAVRMNGRLDFSKVMAHVNEVIDGIYEHEKPEVFEKQGIDVIINPEGAKFLDAEHIKMGEEEIMARHAIICTGSSPRKLVVPGSEQIKFLNNENFWSMKELPKSILFVGGGVISAELGQALAVFGSEVTILEQRSRILGILDDDIAEVIIDQFSNDDIKMATGCALKSFEEEDNLIRITFEDDNGAEEIKSFEAVFVAVGRVPNIAGMDLGNAGVEYSEQGIVTDEYLQTSASNIYACGDVTSRFKFTHTASYQANICIDNILKIHSKKNDLSILPWGIFTEPEIGHVGLTESEARKRYGSTVSIFRVDAHIDRFITDDKVQGFIKVIFGENDKVLGAQAIGAHAGEWIQLITLVMKNDIPVQSMNDTIFIYPTYSEIIKKVFSRYLRSKA